VKERERERERESERDHFGGIDMIEQMARNCYADLCPDNELIAYTELLSTLEKGSIQPSGSADCVYR